MKIGLFCDNNPNNNKIVGCKKVVYNLSIGLKKLGYEVVYNIYGDLNGCLQGIPDLFNKKINKNVLIGPEILILPTDNPSLFGYYENWVQPSQWVIDYMKEFPITIGTKFNVWPVGIDTDMFNDKKEKITQDCFIYYKNVTRQTPIERVEEIKLELNKLKLSYKIIEYGKYNEQDLINLCHTSRFAIFCTGTESQGIALMEVMSCNVPVLIYKDEKTFKYGKYEFSNSNVSSAPYFIAKCGCKAMDINKFVENVRHYEPRKYILDNHTLEKGAQKYIDILKNICIH